MREGKKGLFSVEHESHVIISRLNSKRKSERGSDSTKTARVPIMVLQGILQEALDEIEKSPQSRSRSMRGAGG